MFRYPVRYSKTSIFIAMPISVCLSALSWKACNYCRTMPPSIFTWPDCTRPDTFTCKLFWRHLQVAAQLQAITKGDCAAALRTAVDYLSQAEYMSFLRNKLPGIGKSIQEMIGSTAKLQKALDEFEASGQSQLTEMEEASRRPSNAPSADNYDRCRCFDSQLELDM